MVERVRDGDVLGRTEPRGHRRAELVRELVLHLGHDRRPERGRRVLEVPRGDRAEPLLQQAAVDPGGVLEPAASRVVRAEPDAGRREDELRHRTRAEEHRRVDESPEEHVVVRVDEVLADARDVVQLGLDGLRVVRRQHGRVGEELLAPHDPHLRVVREPRRRRGVGGDVDAADPRREGVHGSEGVLQLVDLPEAGRGVVALAEHGVRLRGLTGALVLDRVAVDPREDDVDGEADVGDVVVEHVLDRPPGAAVPLDVHEHELVDRQAATHERVLDGREHLGVGDAPELELHARLGAVPEATERLEAGPEDPEHGLVGVAEAVVDDEDRGLPRRLGVERLVRGGRHDGALGALAVPLVDRDDRPSVVATDEQVVDVTGGECVVEEQQVLDHRLLGREVPVDQGQPSLADDDVGTVETAGGRSRVQQRTLGRRLGLVAHPCPSGRVSRTPCPAPAILPSAGSTRARAGHGREARPASASRGTLTEIPTRMNAAAATSCRAAQTCPGIGTTTTGFQQTAIAAVRATAHHARPRTAKTSTIRASTVTPQRTKTNADESTIATKATRTTAASSDGASAGRVNGGVPSVPAVAPAGRRASGRPDGTPCSDDPAGGRPFRGIRRRSPRGRSPGWSGTSGAGRGPVRAPGGARRRPRGSRPR
ncbi:hypothetical protein Cus16_0358 [Curtobacterium sp. ER1/6]|nr:hypothetical protein Cus16_0358 [Curtobacterium sp. ER1/6]